MELPDGFIALAPRKIASIQTFLEMRASAPLRPEPGGLCLTLERIIEDVDRYLDLFHRVGDAYLWFSRLQMPRADVAELLGCHDYEAYAVTTGDAWEGLVELDFRVASECELRYFGLTPALVGTGAGRFAMNRAIERAWARPIERFWVHTCTLNHPRALAFYRRSGFVPYGRAIEIADDPRLTGIVREDAAPNVPLLRD
jgi:GNAT superfamily N-acetyltransferase